MTFQSSLTRVSTRKREPDGKEYPDGTRIIASSSFSCSPYTTASRDVDQESKADYPLSGFRNVKKGIKSKASGEAAVAEKELFNSTSTKGTLSSSSSEHLSGKRCFMSDHDDDEKENFFRSNSRKHEVFRDEDDDKRKNEEKRGTSSPEQTLTDSRRNSSLFFHMRRKNESKKGSKRNSVTLVYVALVMILMSSSFLPKIFVESRNLHKRSFFSLGCQGSYDKSKFARVDSVCNDCYHLFRDINVYEDCR